jgi:hypothetical protein
MVHSIAERTARIKPTSANTICLVTPDLTHELICLTPEIKADLIVCFCATLRTLLMQEAKNPLPIAPSSPNSVESKGASFNKRTSARGSAIDVRGAVDLMAVRPSSSTLGVHQPSSLLRAATANGAGLALMAEGVLDEVISEHSLHLGTMWSACYVSDEVVAADLVSDPTINLNLRYIPAHYTNFYRAVVF